MFSVNIRIRFRLVISLETTDVNKVTTKHQSLARGNSFVFLQDPTHQQFLAFVVQRHLHSDWANEEVTMSVIDFHDCTLWDFAIEQYRISMSNSDPKQRLISNIYGNLERIPCWWKRGALGIHLGRPCVSVWCVLYMSPSIVSSPPLSVWSHTHKLKC